MSESENSEIEIDRPDEGSGGPSPAGSTANLELIADDLSASMPDVQEHAIEQEKLQENEKLAQYSHLKDRDGGSFDPAVHKTNAKGEPTLSPKGLLIKKPGRKPGQVNSGSSVSKSVLGVPEAKIDNERQRQSARMCGIAMANSMLQLGIVVGGEEWRPIKSDEHGIDEKANLEDAFANYAEIKGWSDFPPGLALTIAVLGYALPRFTMPKTQERVKSTSSWFKRWAANRKLKKHNLRAVDASTKENRDTDPKATLKA